MSAASSSIAMCPSSQPAMRRAGLVAPLWHNTAPREIRDAYRPSSDGQGAKSWLAWQKRLAQKSRTATLCQLLRCHGNPLAWTLPDEAQRGAAPWLLEQLSPLLSARGAVSVSVEPLLREWLCGNESPHGAGYALESLAWCYSLPRLGALVSPETWWDLLEHLVDVAAEAASLDHQQDPCTHQLLAGELPLALAGLLPEIRACRMLAPLARRQLSRGLADLLDGEGVLHARHQRVLRPLLACWTRAAALGSRLPGGCWTDKARDQYVWLVRQALRMSRGDGTHVLSCGTAGARCDELFAAALRLADDPTARQIAAIVLPPGKKTERRTKSGFLSPAEHAEWARAVMLRASWLPASPRLTALFPDQTVCIELESAARVLCSGSWDARVCCDGELAEPRSGWRDICWVSNDEADYLELELPLTHQLRIQRHLMLARRDGFVFLADAVLGRRRARLEYQGSLTMAEGTTFQPAEETREGLLVSGGKPRALVMPLALPEWHVDRRVGTLAQADGQLELRQTLEGRSLLAPLWIDLEPRRLALQRTWRQLTVAERLTPVPADVAAGYRVMIGRQQWLLYRSLARPGNRTLLGHNLVTETLLAHFADGEVDSLVEIE